MSAGALLLLVVLAQVCELTSQSRLCIWDGGRGLKETGAKKVRLRQRVNTEL